jgi:hypothetical protein
MAQGKGYAGDISDHQDCEHVSPAIVRNEKADDDLKRCANSMLFPMQCLLSHLLNSCDDR